MPHDPSRRDRKAIRAALLAKPCIYCGGGQPATTTDHMPSRSLFNDAVWPEGFEFPACASCQKKSRYAETMIGFLAGIYSDPADPPSREESRRRIIGLRRNYPRVFANLLPSREKLARFLRDHGPPTDPVSGEPSHRLLSLDHPEVHDAVNLFGTKLACALHYHETGMIVPRSGAVDIRWYSNMQLVDGAVPDAVIKINGMGHRRLARARRELNRQFTYGAVITETKDAGIYIATFRRSFALQMVVVCDRDAYPDLDYDVMGTPYQPPE
jgi:hypothetical protein